MRRSGRTAVALFAAAACAALVIAASPASADEVSDGLWYYDSFNVQQAHDAGLTGAGITIGVMDGPLYTGLPELQGADITVYPKTGCLNDSGQPIPPTATDYSASHGTETAALLVGSGVGFAGERGVKGIVPQAKLLYYGNGGATVDDQKDIICDAPYGDVLASHINAAVKSGARIITVSSGGDDSDALASAIAHALRSGVIVLGSVSNEPGETAEFPAASNGVIGVQAMNSSGVVQQTNGVSNVDPLTDVVGPGDGILAQGGDSSKSWQDQSLENGTSAATPIVAGFLALDWQKYPKATSNQIIQSLIHNTGKSDHPLAFDPAGLTGYGVAVLTHLLSVDPTKYPDTNPLISTAKGQSPTAAQIAGTSATHSPQPASSAPAATGGGSVVPVVIVVAVIVVIIIAVLVIVFALRRARRSSPAPSDRQKEDGNG